MKSYIEKFTRYFTYVIFLFLNTCDIYKASRINTIVITTSTYMQSRRAQGFIERDIHRSKTVSISLCINKIRSDLNIIRDQIKT